MMKHLGQLDDGEINFIAANGDDISYYQVAATTFYENVMNRELAQFKRIGDNNPFAYS